MIPTTVRHWFRALAILLLMTVPAASSVAKPMPAAARIVAIGDLHGDHAVWTAIARAAGLIDRKGRWAGGRTMLVQTGDIVDRGPDSGLILRDLMRLERQAARAGGRVVVLVGNHEAMMVTGDLRYVHPGEYAAFVDDQSARRRDAAFAAGQAAIEAQYRSQDPTLPPRLIRERWDRSMPLGRIELQAAWHPSGTLGRWIISKPAVARIGDTLFVHGGLSPAFAAVPIDEINRRVAAALSARETFQESIINDPLGPLWYRGLADGSAAAPAAGAAAGAAPQNAVDQQLDRLLAATGAKRIAIGHTPLLSGVAVTHGGRLIRLDGGNGSAYGGVPGYAEIVGDRVTAHRVARPQEQGK